MQTRSASKNRVVSLALMALLLIGFGVQPVAAGPVVQEDMRRHYAAQAADWLSAQQRPDGGLGSPGQTCETVLALVAAGRDPSSVITNGNSLLDYLALQTETYSSSGWDPANQTALLVQAVVAAGENPYGFGGVDLVSRLQSFDKGDGTFGTGNWSLASYLIALATLGQPAPGAVLNTLKANQSPSGAWEYSTGWGDDLDTTGKVLQGLVAAGEPLASPTLAQAVAYIQAQQQPHGGWQTAWDADLNPNTTAQVIQGLLAVGLNPLTDTVSATGATPLDALETVRNTATGAFQFDGVDSVLATEQVVPALLGRTFPLYGRGLAFHQAIAYLTGEQQTDGGFPGWAGTDAGITLDVILAGAAADWEPRDWTAGGNTALDFIATVAITYTTPTTSTWDSSVYTTTAVAQMGKLIAGVVAAEGYSLGGDSAQFAGLSLKDQLDANLAWSPTDNSLADYAWAAIGYAALGEAVPITVTDRILALQEAAGGWSYWGDYAYGTALAIQGLVATDISPTSTEMISATAFLHTLQDVDTGGFSTAPGGSANAVGTGNVLLAIAALGKHPWAFAVSPSSGVTLTVNTPDQWLLKAQSQAGDWEDTALATAQVMQGLSSRALPFHLRPVVISTGLERRTEVPRWGAFHAQFNTELDPESVNATTFTLSGPQGQVPCSVTYQARLATLSPSAPLMGNTQYRLTVQGIKGARLGIQGPSYHWDVTTELYRLHLPLMARPN